MLSITLQTIEIPGGSVGLHFSRKIIPFCWYFAKWCRDSNTSYLPVLFPSFSQLLTWSEIKISGDSKMVRWCMFRKQWWGRAHPACSAFAPLATQTCLFFSLHFIFSFSPVHWVNSVPCEYVGFVSFLKNGHDPGIPRYWTLTLFHWVIKTSIFLFQNGLPKKKCSYQLLGIKYSLYHYTGNLNIIHRSSNGRFKHPRSLLSQEASDCIRSIQIQFEFWNFHMAERI